MHLSVQLKNLDKNFVKFLEDKAKKEGNEIDDPIVSLIYQSLKKEKIFPPTQEIYHDLDNLAGTWGDEDTKIFIGSIADFEKIDEEIWK